MRKRVISFKARLSARLIALLGIGAVASSCDGPWGACEYGSPYVRLNIKGKVTDPSGQPIKGIQVSFKEYAPTAFTLEDGTYTIEDDLPAFDVQQIVVVAEDVDGTANGGEFVSKEITTELTQDEPADGWYKGGYTATVDIQLESK